MPYRRKKLTFAISSPDEFLFETWCSIFWFTSTCSVLSVCRVKFSFFNTRLSYWVGILKTLEKTCFVF